MIASAVSPVHPSDTVNQRDEFVMSQLPEVQYIARRIHRQLPTVVPLEDLIHSGVLGLLEATQKYDSTINVQFKTYAQFRIRGAILDGLRELDHASRRMRKKSRNLDAAAEKLSLRLGRRATEEEIAHELGLDLAALRKLATTLHSLEPVDRQSIGGKDHMEGLDLIESAPAKPEDGPFAQYLRSEMRQHLAQALSALPQREKQILVLYYFEQHTMQEIASILGVNNSRISQMHCAAIAKLRVHLHTRESNDDSKAGVESTHCSKTKRVSGANHGNE